MQHVDLDPVAAIRPGSTRAELEDAYNVTVSQSSLGIGFSAGGLGPGVWQKFELHGSSRFLLHHYCARSYLPTTDNVSDFHPDEIATAKLGVDHEIEQRPVSQVTPLIEIKSDLPYLLRFQGTLGADCPSNIPDLTFGGSGFCFGHLHDCSSDGHDWPSEERLSAQSVNPYEAIRPSLRRFEEVSGNSAHAITGHSRV